MLDLKQHSIGHYSITTSLGQKRYLSFLTCIEPLMPKSHATDPVEVTLAPFAYILVQEEASFKFSSQILKGIYETTLKPYY
jgi:hypothetical protein